YRALERIVGTGRDHSEHREILCEAVVLDVVGVDVERCGHAIAVIDVVSRVADGVHVVDADRGPTGYRGHVRWDGKARTAEPDGEHIIEPTAHPFQVLFTGEREVE